MRVVCIGYFPAFYAAPLNSSKSAKKKLQRKWNGEVYSEYTPVGRKHLDTKKLKKDDHKSNTCLEKKCIALINPQLPPKS